MKKALVTGANKGIGYTIAKYLMQKGWYVLIGARNRELGEQAVTQLNQMGVGKAEWLQVDLADLNQLEQCVATVQNAHADLSLLINNAGIPGDMSVASYETQVADLIATTQVNFFGTFALTQGLIPTLANNHGRIVNVTIPTSIHHHWNPLATKPAKPHKTAWLNILLLTLRKIIFLWKFTLFTQALRQRI